MLTVDRSPSRLWRDIPRTLKVTTAPTAEPVSIADAKRQAGIIDGGELDDLFSGWIKAAREMVEEDARRALLPQTCKLYLDYFPRAGEPIELEKPPIVSVTSVEYYDAAGDLQTWDDDYWLADVNSEPGYVSPVYGLAWPVTQPRKGAVIVAFTAGWPDASRVPWRAKQAVLMLAAYYALHREAAGSEKMEEKPLGYEALVRRIKWGPDA